MNKKKIGGVLLLFLLMATPVFAVRTIEIKDMLVKTSASYGDAIYLVACLKDAKLTRKQIKGSDSTNNLSYGQLAALILDETETSGVWLYELLHWSRYAYLSGVEKGWMSSEYSANRKVSGMELVSVIGRVKQGVEK